MTFSNVSSGSPPSWIRETNVAVNSAAAWNLKPSKVTSNTAIASTPKSDEIRTDRQKARKRQLHAIRGSAVDSQPSGSGFMNAQRPMQSQSVAHGILFAIGSDGINLAHALEIFLQCDDTVRINTVVVGKQNNHGRILAKKQQTNKGRQTLAAAGSCVPRVA